MTLFFLICSKRQILRLNCKSFLSRIGTFTLKLRLPVGQVNVDLLVKVMLDHLINVLEVHSDLKQNKTNLEVECKR